jgi:hypothetical protein
MGKRYFDVCASDHSRPWDGQFQFVARDGGFRHAHDESLPPVLVFSVTPTQVLAFTRGTRAGHTTHRFCAQDILEFPIPRIAE